MVCVMVLSQTKSRDPAEISDFVSLVAKMCAFAGPRPVTT